MRDFSDSKLKEFLKKFQNKLIEVNNQSWIVSLAKEPFKQWVEQNVINPGQRMNAGAELKEITAACNAALQKKSNGSKKNVFKVESGGMVLTKFYHHTDLVVTFFPAAPVETSAPAASTSKAVVPAAARQVHGSSAAASNSRGVPTKQSPTKTLVAQPQQSSGNRPAPRAPLSQPPEGEQSEQATDEKGSADPPQERAPRGVGADRWIQGRLMDEESDCPTSFADAVKEPADTVKDASSPSGAGRSYEVLEENRKLKAEVHRLKVTQQSSICAAAELALRMLLSEKAGKWFSEPAKALDWARTSGTREEGIEYEGLKWERQLLTHDARDYSESEWSDTMKIVDIQSMSSEDPSRLSRHCACMSFGARVHKEDVMQFLRVLGLQVDEIIIGTLKDETTPFATVACRRVSDADAILYNRIVRANLYGDTQLQVRGVWPYNPPQLSAKLHFKNFMLECLDAEDLKVLASSFISDGEEVQVTINKYYGNIALSGYLEFSKSEDARRLLMQLKDSDDPHLQGGKVLEGVLDFPIAFRSA